MVENCSVCGNKLEDDFKFCPECGEKVPIPKKTKTTKKVETKAKTKNKKKKTPIKFTLPKLTMNIPRKTALAAIAIICIAVVVAAGVVVISPFDATSSVVSVKQEDFGGRVFKATVENTCGCEAECYLKVGALKYGETFTVLPEEKIIVDVVEDSLNPNLLSSNYDITLYAAIDYMTEGTAFDVTESAEFSILEEDGELIIENTGAR